ncbi:hypothetical protein RB195_024602 [Necator americanus]|uniref:IRG-type G domain-containing protein n=1 Tax=Necator americanus TaxID=51031 RepID=A0ABR1EP00_NECAM
MLFTKSDGDIDAESRELAYPIDCSLKREYEHRARSIFQEFLTMKAPILTSIVLLHISSPIVKNLVSGTIGSISNYSIEDEDCSKRPMELDLDSLQRHVKADSCKTSHELTVALGASQTTVVRGLESIDKRELESIQKTEVMEKNALHHKFSVVRYREPSAVLLPPLEVQKSTVLADAGFEILYGIDDRVFGNFVPKSSVRRTGRTALNYGFIGRAGVGKSAIINAIRGISSKHPLAAGVIRTRRGICERFEFDGDLLKYSVTLWELQYPKNISTYFEFIDRYGVTNFTAIFVLIGETPSEEDLSFSKIAHRRNAYVVFLSSKNDQKLAARSRRYEVPVCDLLKQRYLNKGLSQFDRALGANAPELCGRVHIFFVGAPVFRALRTGDARGMQYSLHERVVFDFLKQKRIVADLVGSRKVYNDGFLVDANFDTADKPEEPIDKESRQIRLSFLRFKKII